MPRPNLEAKAAPSDLRRPHLPPLETRLFLGAVPWRLRENLLHLLRCADCRDALDAELRRAESAPPAPPPDARYDQAFARAEERSGAVPEELRRAVDLLDEMFQLPPRDWPAFLAERPEVGQPMVVLLLLEQAARATATDPETGERLAHLARMLLERVDSILAPGLLRIELQARAWTLQGHARALRHEWQSADEAFAQSSRLLSDAPSPEAEADLCRLVGASFEARNRHPEAIALLTRATLLADEAGPAETEIGVLGELARLHLQRADTGCAVGLLAGAVVLASTGGLPLTASQLRPRLSWTLQALGRRREALEVAAPCEVATSAAGTLEGMLGTALVHACRGEVRYAEAVFGIALSQALDQGEDFSAAVAALNLIGIYDQEGRAADHVALAPTIGALAHAPGLSGATRAALAALHAALRDQTGSLGLLLLGAVAALDHEAQETGERPAAQGGTDCNER